MSSLGKYVFPNLPKIWSYQNNTTTEYSVQWSFEKRKKAKSTLAENVRLTVNEVIVF